MNGGLFHSLFSALLHIVVKMLISDVDGVHVEKSRDDMGVEPDPEA